ncbi:MAG TPA: hypothetical protein VIN40_05110 [Candidatus Tyrphobacter sp.]
MLLRIRVLAALFLGFLFYYGAAPCAAPGATLRFRHCVASTSLRAPTRTLPRGSPTGAAPCAAPDATPRSTRALPHGSRGISAPEELYARRALRRARLIIEMRLLQFRLERLECVRRAILRNLPPDLRPAERGSEGARPLDPETCANLFH